MSEQEGMTGEATLQLAHAAERLARQAAARDPEAWAQLFEAHFRAVYTFVRYRIHDAAEAEDIASQVFEVAYARAHSFDYRGLPFESWLFGIARNLVRDHIKRSARRGVSTPVEDAVMPAEPDRAAAIDLQQDIRAAMLSLTEDQQTVITHRFLLDRSVADTARSMSRSEDAVKTLQRRALAALQRQLGDISYLEGTS